MQVRVRRGERVRESLDAEIANCWPILTTETSYSSKEVWVLESAKAALADRMHEAASNAAITWTREKPIS